ncbi:histidine kinase [Alkalibacterium sp. m-11]|uniref:Signal transduction histidine kinase internal region domain-containing protein n=1 Tax=Alkalibacterium indicireducens TaxID=398758 RepID=A0ABN1AX70_9LACT
MSNTTQTFAQVVPETLSTIDHSFYQTNTNLIEQYISGTGSIETSQIYRLFYTFNSQQQIKSDLLLFDSKKKLEAQFHPHFLANTLETIRSAMYIDTQLANEVLLRMNSLLRYSVD